MIRDASTAGRVEVTWRAFALWGALLLAVVVGAPGCQSTGSGERPDGGPPGIGQVAGDDSGAEPEDDFDDEFGEFEDEFGEPVEAFDPLSGYNRMMFAFNDRAYLWVIQPAAKGYNWLVPEPARVCVDRFFRNVKTPIRFVNGVLQLKFDTAGSELGRLLINSTLGIAGLFDAAEGLFDWKAPPPEDFGQTLGHWGVGGGFPIVLPILGPSNVRDTIGLAPDSFLTPVPYVVGYWESVGITAGEYFNWSSLHVGEYESLKKDHLDPYTFFRDAYEQNRNEKIEE